MTVTEGKGGLEIVAGSVSRSPITDFWVMGGAVDPEIMSCWESR